MCACKVTDFLLRLEVCCFCPALLLLSSCPQLSVLLMSCHLSCPLKPLNLTADQRVSEHSASLSFLLPSDCFWQAYMVRPQEGEICPQNIRVRLKSQIQRKQVDAGGKCKPQLSGSALFCSSKNGHIDVHIWHLHFQQASTSRSSQKPDRRHTPTHTHIHTLNTAGLRPASSTPCLCQCCHRCSKHAA